MLVTADGKGRFQCPVRIHVCPTCLSEVLSLDHVRSGRLRQLSTRCEVKTNSEDGPNSPTRSPVYIPSPRLLHHLYPHSGRPPPCDALTRDDSRRWGLRDGAVWL